MPIWSCEWYSPRDELYQFAIQPRIGAIVAQSTRVKVTIHELANHGNGDSDEPYWTISVGHSLYRLRRESVQGILPMPQSQYHFRSSHMVT